MEDLSILSSQGFFFTLAFMKGVEKSIKSSIGLALAIIDLEIVLQELLSPTDMLVLCIHKSIEVIMIYKYRNFMMTALKVGV